MLSNSHGYTNKEVQEWFSMYKMCRMYLSANREKNKELLVLIHDFMESFEVIHPDSKNNTEWLHEKIGSVPRQDRLPPRPTKAEKSSVAIEKSNVAGTKIENSKAKVNDEDEDEYWLYKIIGSAPSKHKLPRKPFPRALQRQQDQVR